MNSRSDAEIPITPRSIIPGRQRWSVQSLRGSPSRAALVEDRIRQSPGIREVHANPVTGRVLIYHDASLAGAEVGQLIRQAVGTTSVPLVVEPSIVAAGAAATLAIVALPPLARLGVVLVITALVIRHTWCASGVAQRDQRGPEKEEAVQSPLLRMVGAHRGAFYAVSALSVLAQVMTITFSMCIGLLGMVFFNGPISVLAGLGPATVGAQLLFLGGAAVLLYAAGSVFSYRAGVYWNDLAQTVQHEWRHEMYAYVQRVEFQYLEDERTTRVSQILTADADQLGRFLAISANELIQLGTSFAVVLAAFTVFTPVIAWLVFLPVPLIVWMSARYHDRMAPLYSAAMEKQSELTSRLINTLEASSTVRSFCAEDYEIHRIRELSAEYSESNRRISRAAVAYGETVRACVTASFGATLVGGGRAAMKGVISVETFVPLAGLPQQLLSKLPTLGDHLSQYQQTVAALRRLIALSELPAEPDGDGLRLTPAQVKGELALDGVTFAYPGRSPVLNDVSLHIAAGQVTAIVGGSGVGKSTIAKLLLRFRRAESGRVLLDGQDIRELALGDLRKVIAFVAQTPFLFDGTIADNISYGSFDAGQDRIVGAARLSAADRFVTGLPLGYGTPTGERGMNLSGGQRQRVVLARALVKDAQVLILDEATSALDNAIEADIQRSLKDFASGRTIIIIAHRLSTISSADCIYVLDSSGTVAEQGTHDELVERGGLYASLWRLQVGENLP